MPSPFLPSPIASATVVQVERGAPDQPTGVLALPGAGTPDQHNPMYETVAERVESVAPFLAANKAKQDLDSDVLPGGRSLYSAEALAELRDKRKMVWPIDLYEGRVPVDVSGSNYRVTQPPMSSAKLEFPDVSRPGHTHELSLRIRR